MPLKRLYANDVGNLFRLSECTIFLYSQLNTVNEGYHSYSGVQK